MNKQTTSEQIRTLRKNKGLSQEALAEMAGNTVAGVADFGKRVLQFQAAWTVLAYGISLISMFSSIFGRLGVPQFPLYFSSALLVINTIVIAWTHFAIDRPKVNLFGFKLKALL